MVDNQVNVNKKAIANSTTEQTSQVTGTLTTFHKLDIEPSENTIASGGSPAQITYDFLVANSGAAAGITLDVHNRSVIVGDNPPATPQVVSTFFTSVLAVASSEFHVVPRQNNNGPVTYDLFFTYEAGAGAVTYELTIVTLDVLPGTFPTLPTTTNAPAQVKSVLRETNGIVRTYDYFILSVP